MKITHRHPQALAHAGAALLASALMTTIGCNGGSTPASTAGGGSDGAAPVESQAAATPAWRLDAAPVEFVDVASIKKTAKEGDQVVVRGRIGGRAEPFVEGAAVFIIMDPAIPDCSAKEDDHCPIPWDYCCETPETIMANSATVQIVDGDGQPLLVDLTQQGLKPQDEVIVVGAVGPRPDWPNSNVLVIDATGVYRTP